MHAIPIAAALSLLTMLVLYVAWYAVVGRRIRLRKAERLRKAAEKGKAAPEPAGTPPSGTAGTKKGTYCYPSINDVMGYEFVRVVDVPEDILGIPKAKEEQDAQKAAKSRGIGARTVSVTTVSSGEDTERAIREIEGEEEGNRIAKGRGDGGPSQKEDAAATTEGEGEQEDISTFIPAEDIEDLNDATVWNFGQWSNRDYDDDLPSDAEFADMIDSEPEIIEEPTDTEAQERIARDRESLRRYEEFRQRLYERNATVPDDTGASILEELADMGGAGEEEDGAGAEIDEDDVPEI